MKQLNTLLKFEQDKTDRCAEQLKLAENECQQNIIRLQGVSDYRLEYMKRLNERAQTGVDSSTYGHYHAFIAKLDQAGKQVEIALHQAQALAEQSKALWLKQRQKVKAVELLRNKRLEKIALAGQKLEQKMFDEIATQQFIRRKLSS